MTRHKQHWNVRVVPPRKGKDGEGWIIRARPPRGVHGDKEIRRRIKNPDRAVAEREASRLEADLNAALVVPDNPTLGDIYERHLGAREADSDTAENTRRSYRNARPRLSATELWGMPCSLIDRQALVCAQDALKALPLAASTVNLYMSLVRATWKWAFERGLVAREWPGLRSLRKPKMEKRPFRDDEVMRLLDCIRGRAGGRWYAFFSLQAAVGARIESLCKLRGRDLHLGSRPVVTLRSKGKTWPAPVPAEVMALLPKVGPDDYLWTATKGGPVRRETPYGVFAKALKDAGIADLETLDTHSLRRGFVSTCLREGVAIPVAMRVTGHSDVKVFMGYQANAADYDTHEAVEKVHAVRAAARRASLPTSLPNGADLGRESEAQPVGVAGGSARDYDLTS